MDEANLEQRNRNIVAEWVGGDPKHYQSFVNLELIFQGTFVDDIASAIYRVPFPVRVLVLGTSLASVLLPLSVFPIVKEVTLVDLEETRSPLIEQAKLSMSTHMVVADAVDYLHRTDETFDLIYVDLFDEHGYAEPMLSETLYQAAVERLSQSGAVLINAFDIPSYLFPEIGETVTVALMNLLAEAGLEVVFLKHRRNTLLLAMKGGGHQTYAHTTRRLNGSDAQRLRISQERSLEFRHALLPSKAPGSQSTKVPFKRISSLLHVRLKALVNECSSRLDLGSWASFYDFALHADPLEPSIRRALSNSEFLRHIVLMELAAHAYTDPDLSLNRVKALIESANVPYLFGGTFRSQASADLHAIGLWTRRNKQRELDGMIARMTR